MSVTSNYHILPQVEKKHLIVHMPNEKKGNLRWFSFMQIVCVEPKVKSLDRITVNSSTYLETTAKVDEVVGNHTIIIVDSPLIGSVKAKRVVLCHSQALAIEADIIYLFKARVNGDMVAKKIERDLIQIWPEVKTKPSSILSFLATTNNSEEKKAKSKDEEKKVEFKPPDLMLLIYPGR